MIGEQLISREPVTLSKAKNLLEKRKLDSELSYEQEEALKYAKIFSKVTKKQRDKIMEELNKLGKIRPELAVKIVDILPQDIEILRLLPDKKDELKDEDLEAVLQIIKKYGPKKKES
ncbi:MAG: RNA polymerase Rpb4 family protein [Candidatus Diapherotrites archaeon]|nr:RNA polymerase Rpb4 family protein [Candidatus Diapherotrites archaeon]